MMSSGAASAGTPGRRRRALRLPLPPLPSVQALARSAASPTSSRPFGGGRRGPGRPRLPVQRAPGDRARPRPPGCWPRRSTAPTPRRRALRGVRLLRRHRPGHLARRPGARRRLEQRRRRHAGPRLARGAGHPGPLEALHRRRGPHALDGGRQRAAEDARGAALPRRLRPRHHRPPEGPAHRAQPDPALRVPPPRCRDAGELLSWVRDQAGLDLDDEALALAVRRGRGSARDALSALDQMASSGRPRGSAPSSAVWSTRCATRMPGRVLVVVASLVEAGWSPQQLASEVVDDLRQAFLLVVGPRAGLGQRDRARSADRPGGAPRTGPAGPGHGGTRARPGRHAGGTRRPGRPRGHAGPPRPQRARQRPRRVGRADEPGSNRPSPCRERPGATAARADPPSDPWPPTGRTPRPAPDPRTRPSIGALRRQRAEQSARAEAEPPPPGHPASPPPAAVPAGAAGATGEIPDRDTLVEAWGDHLLRSLPARAKALYSSGRFVAVEGSTAVFAAAEHRATCAGARRSGRSSRRRSAAHFSTPVGLRLVVDDVEAAARRGGPGRLGAGPDRPR